MPCCALFLDLAKAFDTVQHTLLLKKLEIYGIRGLPLNLFVNYLKNRQQKVVLGNVSSDNEFIQCGVPQGTVIGPILFLLYMNDLLNNINIKSKIIAYADDMAIFIEARSWEEVRCVAEHDIKEIKTWLDLNMLSLNYNKTYFMPFSIYNNTQPEFDHIRLHENVCSMDNNCNCSIKINKTISTKYLGLIIDNHFRWDAHTEKLGCNLRKTFYIFKKLREILPIKILYQFYYALVQSIVSYGIIAWGEQQNPT